MNDLWFTGGEEYDRLCQPLRDTIRAAGKGLLDWNDSVDGLMGQLVLCDQLSRNCFRGTPEAFAYDDRAVSLARQLTDRALSGDAATQQEFYPPYLCFMVTGLMHSESVENHEKALEVLNHAEATSPEHLKDWWKNQRDFELDHKRVIDRFGRYPHRNCLKGRQSTPEESMWLSDEENLPGWAKSQL
jgi:uncharacterized protein (DUF924 family)